MNKKISLTICLIYLTSFLSCSQSDKNPDDVVVLHNAVSEDTVKTEWEEPANYDLNEFDKSFIDYLCLNRYYNSNLVVSPASLRASLCLAAAGAKDNNVSELISAAVFSDIDEMNVWYRFFRHASDTYSAGFNIGDKSVIPYSVDNSVWSSKDLIGYFKDSYILKVQ